MSYQQPRARKSNAGLWIGGAAILLVAFIAVLVLLLNRQPAPAAPASAVIVSAPTTTSAPADTPTAVVSPTPAPIDTPTLTPMPELGTSNVFIEYILDASGSMTETLSDGSSKIDVAKQVLTNHMRSFRPETNIGLRAYGHRLPYRQEAESCKDIELVAPVEKGQMERIVGFLQDFKAQGMTPLAASLQQAKEDFTFEAPRVNSIVMLSDGIETCSGDPCKLVEDLKAQGINFTIHVIGLDVDDPTRQQLTCIAQAGGGTYHDANSKQDLDTALNTVKTEVTKDELVVPPGVNTPTPVLPTSTPTLVPPTPTPALGIGSTMISEKDGMEMVYVPAGEFLMGSPEGEGEDDEHPQHTVFLDAYWIDKTEVTVAQYRRCAEAGSCSAPGTGSTCTYGDDNKPKHPVNCVDWSQAEAYCEWAGRRLPTEAEWEMAACGTDGRVYPWGHQEPDATLANLAPNVGSTTPVGQYPAGVSPYGALDMVGNVWELVADWYDESYFASSPRENPTGPATGFPHVMRGGSWTNDLNIVRAALRSWLYPGDRLGFVGFRCARSP